MRIVIVFYLIFVSIFCSGIEKKKNETLFYEAESVELRGLFQNKTFPGPPNYESIKSGDEAESGIYISLLAPIDVTSDLSKPSEYRDDTEKSLKLIQLIVYNDHLFPLIRKFRKNKTVVTLKGKLIHRLTGHHHTPVLLEVSEVSKFEPIKK